MKTTAVSAFAKALTLAVLAVPPALAVSAQDEAYALVVTQRSGEVDNYFLTSSPEITFEGTKCHVKSSVLTSEYDMGDVEKAEVMKVKTSAVSSVTDGFGVDYTDPETITVYGLPSVCTVRVIETGGTVRTETTAGDDGSARISLAGFPAGIYIVAASNGKTFKIYRK